MEQLIRGIWLGGDQDVAEAIKRGYARLCCCKEGIDSHRSMLGYITRGAPKGPEYLFARRDDVMALNLIDVDDPELIPDAVLDAGIRFIKEMQDTGKKILVHCNAGRSRGPTTAMMYLRTVGELPYGFVRAQKVFRTIYDKYDPGVGMEAHSHTRWEALMNFFKA